jgi:dGTP triphosphohydrolase
MNEPQKDLIKLIDECTKLRMEYNKLDAEAKQALVEADERNKQEDILRRQLAIAKDISYSARSRENALRANATNIAMKLDGIANTVCNLLINGARHE